MSAVVATGRDTTLDVRGEGTGGVAPGSSVPAPVVPTPSTEVAFEVLAMAQASEPMGTLRAAVDPAGLDALWAGIGFAGDPPAVDLAQSVVVSMTIPDDACPPTLTAFDRDGSVLTPVFVEPTDGCFAPLIPKTFVVAIARSSVEPRFTLRLPGWNSVTDGFGEQRLDVEIPPLGDTTVGAGAPPSTALTTWSATPAPSTEGSVVATVALPPVGRPALVRLADGFPVWVVHHADGTVSALPAVVDRSRHHASDGNVDWPSGLWATVIAAGDGPRFVGPGQWDGWGRADTTPLNPGTQDLVGFEAQVEGDQVRITRSLRTEVPGEVVPATGSGLVGYDLGPPARSLEGLAGGWHLVELDLVGADDVYRICAGWAAGSPVLRCPDDSPLAPSLVGPTDHLTWIKGPLLVELDPDGAILAIAPIGDGWSTHPDLP